MDPCWSERANCFDSDPALFFPPDGGSYKAARAICRGCSVVAECLESIREFETTHAAFGMFGGMSPIDRRSLPRSRPCLHCRDLFVPDHHQERTCSDECSAALRAETYRRHSAAVRA